MRAVTFGELFVIEVSHESVFFCNTILSLTTVAWKLDDKLKFVGHFGIKGRQKAVGWRRKDPA